jgi:hypothetical protein
MFQISSAEIQRSGLRHLVGAGLVGRRVRLDGVLGDQTFREHVGFDFLAADVGKHVAVDLDAGAHHLAALVDHFLTLQWIIDDVAVFEGQVVFAHDGADAVAPAATRFQVGDDFRFAHRH